MILRGVFGQKTNAYPTKGPEKLIEYIIIKTSYIYEGCCTLWPIEIDEGGLKRLKGVYKQVQTCDSLGWVCVCH
jgi:hypothetical protein